MRLLLVFSVVVAVTMAEGCTEAVNESNYGVIANYSAEPEHGKYANGTTVKLTCKVLGFFVNWGGDEATCVDGKWIPNDDMCQLSKLKKLGYRTMWVAGADKRQDYFQHGTTAYALCDIIVSDMPYYYPPNMMCIDGRWMRSRGKGNCFGRN